MDQKTKVLAVISFSIAIFFFAFHAPFLRALFAFLCVNKPVKAKVLVIEGWLFDYMLNDAAAEFLNGGYEYCIISGQYNRKTNPDSLSAEEVLKIAGIDSTKIITTAPFDKRRHRTYQQASTVKKWLHDNDPTISAVNVFTGGPHGRKTWTVYKKTLGKGFSVGILSCKIQHFNSDRWWTSRRGLLVTTKFAAGYIYALVWPFKS